VAEGVNAEGVKPLPYERWLTAIVRAIASNFSGKPPKMIRNQVF